MPQHSVATWHCPVTGSLRCGTQSTLTRHVLKLNQRQRLACFLVARVGKLSGCRPWPGQLPWQLPAGMTGEEAYTCTFNRDCLDGSWTPGKSKLCTCATGMTRRQG
jgi:hypothetical protein